MQDDIDEGDDKKVEKYKQGNLRVGITVSFDTGWNKRSSGNRYDSMLGHYTQHVNDCKNLSTPLIYNKTR